MSYEEFRLIIEDYRLDCHFPKRIFRNEERCENVSWCFWALDEIMIYIGENTGRDILESVSDFARLMRRYMRAYPRTQRMFFVAADVADDIMDILRCSYTAENRKDI